jgi:hypothetical protein
MVYGESAAALLLRTKSIRHKRVPWLRCTAGGQGRCWSRYCFKHRTRPRRINCRGARALHEGHKGLRARAFDEAIREYSEAYPLHPDAAILYHLGQAHRLAGHPKEALFFYRMYLAPYDIVGRSMQRYTNDTGVPSRISCRLAIARRFT